MAIAFHSSWSETSGSDCPTHWYQYRAFAASPSCRCRWADQVAVGSALALLGTAMCPVPLTLAGPPQRLQGQAGVFRRGCIASKSARMLRPSSWPGSSFRQLQDAIGSMSMRSRMTGKLHPVTGDARNVGCCPAPNRFLHARNGRPNIRRSAALGRPPRRRRVPLAAYGRGGAGERPRACCRGRG